jgi:hypothetical protein
MRIPIRGRIWHLVHTNDLPEDTDGECDAPWIKKKKIKIRKDLNGEHLIDTYIHECAHAALWDLGEGPVASLANAIAYELWNSGIRPGYKTTKKNLDKLEYEIISIIWVRGEVAMFEESVRREVAHAMALMLNKLGWSFYNCSVL